MQRACKACGRTDTMVGKRLGAKFCDATCRKRWQRRNDEPKQRFKMNNNLRTDLLECHIALAIFYDVTGESALRLLAERLEVPIRQEEIDKQLTKVEEESESFLSGSEGA